jgi:hypothetical protein
MWWFSSIFENNSFLLEKNVVKHRENYEFLDEVEHSHLISLQTLLGTMAKFQIHLGMGINY